MFTVLSVELDSTNKPVRGLVMNTKAAIENLVVLQYSSNSCVTEVVDFDPEDLPVGVAELDAEKGKWTSDKNGYNPGTRVLEIGIGTRKCDFGCRFGVIGLYDRTSTEHLDRMVRASQDATRPQGNVLDT